MLVSEWLALFRGVIKKGDYWVAHCPGHPDTHQSLSIREGDKQAVLLKCHAGCPNTAIVEAVGKKPKDLFNDPARGAGRRHLTTVKIVTSYDYYDEAGTLLYANVRFEPKDFKQRRPHPTLADTWLGGISAGWYAPGKSPFGWPRVSGADAGARPAEQPASQM